MLEKEKAQLFITCLIDTFFPSVGEAIVEVLGRAGVRIEFLQEQTCCGQPAFNAGYWDEARKMALHTMDIYLQTDGDIIVPSGSCAAMMKYHYLQLFENDNLNYIKALKFSARIFELSHYLHDIVGFLPSKQLHNEIVAYHPSCHLLRKMKIDKQPKNLLEAAGLQVVTLEADCCGFGGVFSVDFPSISEEMLKRKLKAIKETNARWVVGADVSCLMHIEGGLRRENSSTRCAYFAQFLTDKGLGLR
jgi:L-lactate dehydrogenase complex protein LldE